MKTARDGWLEYQPKRVARWPFRKHAPAVTAPTTNATSGQVCESRIIKPIATPSALSAPEQRQPQRFGRFKISRGGLRSALRRSKNTRQSDRIMQCLMIEMSIGTNIRKSTMSRS